MLGAGEGHELGEAKVAYLRNEVSREERWSAMALIGRFDPFGLSEISETSGLGLIGLVGGRVAFTGGFLVTTFFWNCFWRGLMGLRLGPRGRRKDLEGPKGPGTLGGSWGRFEMNGDCLRLGGTCGRPITG